jgi:hypothetical protein
MVRGLAGALRQRIKRDADRLTASPEDCETQYGGLCDLLEYEDRRLLRELKLTIRDGVRVFEDHQRDTVTAGGDQLMRIMRSVPSILQEFYDHVNTYNQTAI